MNSKSTLLFAVLCSIILSACGTESPSELAPIGVIQDDEAIVHGRAVANVSSESDSFLAKLFYKFFIQKAYAASGSTTVTYTNAASTNFSINVSSFAPGAMTGNTLSLGSVALSTLSDNDLKVCGSDGKTKCTKATIRVYTTGSVTGFVHTEDAYGAPIYTGTLSPATPVGLNAAGSVQVQNLIIATSKNKLAIADFPSPTYSVSADFSNAGAGSYSMTYVVEYVLLP